MKRVSSNVSSDEGDISSVEGGSESVPGLSKPPPYCKTDSCHKSSSSISSSASDEEDADESGPGENSTASNPAMDMPLLPSQQCSTHMHKVPRGKEENEAFHINDGSSPLSVFLLYLAEIITLLVVETNPYYQDYIDLTMDPLLNLTLLKPTCLCFSH